ncbi:MAG TPA: hypothetical protein VE643_08265 [Nitrososphaeraceae archaeon]|nr:hypothetical protein [Nitrososphaeraceae archaeon]
MEKQYYSKYNSRVCFIIKKAIVPILLSTVLMIALSHILLVCNAQESFSGLQVFVHVTGTGGHIPVCVFPNRENLVCRLISGPDTVPFVFSTQSLDDEQKLTTCIQYVKLRCMAYIYDASPSAGKHVYLSVPKPSNMARQQNQLGIAAPVSLTQISYSQRFVLYTNPDKDFKIWYPSDWSINEGNITHSGAIIASPDKTGRIVVSARNASPIESSMTPPELAKSVLSSSQNDSRSRLIELDANNFFLSGHPAVKIVQIRNNGTGLEDGADIQYKSMSLVTIVEGKAYFVSYIAQPEKYPNYLQTAQTIIDSFEITNK